MENKFKGKKILLTGGCGFIGNNFTKSLLQEDIKDLLVIDKISYCSSSNYHIKNNIKLYTLDINDSLIKNIILNYNPDIIIHMAAESHVDLSISNPDLFCKSNVNGTVNLLNTAIKLNNLELFHYISTDEVYGDIEKFVSSTEKDILKPSSPYSASKASGEFFVQSYSRTYNIPYLITRSSNNYGPYQYPDKFIPKSIVSLLNNKKIPVYGSGLQERDWIYVVDNCKALIACINNKNCYNSVTNIGSNLSMSNIDIIQILCFLLEKDFIPSFTHIADRLGHDKRYALSTEKINKFWKPEIALDEGLVRTIEWYKDIKNLADVWSAYV